MGKITALSRLFIKAGQKNYLKQFKEAGTKTFAGTITLPHFAQFNFLKNNTKLTGKKLAYAYGAATLATPVFIAATTSGEGSQKAIRNSIIGGSIFGPAGSALAGMVTLDNEANKLEQKRLEQEEEDNYFERMYYEDEEFRNEYEKERQKELEEDQQYDELG